MLAAIALSVALSVNVIGDSVTYNSTDDMHVVDPGVEIRGVPGSTTAQALDWATWASGDVVVVALGTNDLPHIERAENVAQIVRTVEVRVGPTRPILWVTPFSFAWVEQSRIFRETLLASPHQVIDWFSIATPDMFPPGDPTHPNAEGQMVWAELVRDAVELHVLMRSLAATPFPAMW
jgi:lysophospholipase L1-like esterase